MKFMIHHHIASRDHYDFRLELNGVYLSWAIPKGPSFNPSDKRLAVQVEDHSLEFGNFEGVIPKGEYGAGIIMIWDKGIWESETKAEEELKSGSLKFVLNGERLKGKWKMVRLKGDNKNWLLIKEKDGFAQTDAGIDSYKESLTTGRTFEEIEKQS